MDILLRDLKYSLRLLARSPTFTTVAVLTLALGIAANIAIFSMVNGILLRALPHALPGQLYAIHEVVPQWTTYGPSLPVNGGNFLAWSKESNAISAMTLIDSADGSLLGMGRPQWLYGAAVTSDFFSILGIRPAMGRAFLLGEGASESRPGSFEVRMRLDAGRRSEDSSGGACAPDWRNESGSKRPCRLNPCEDCPADCRLN